MAWNRRSDPATIPNVRSAIGVLGVLAIARASADPSTASKAETAANDAAAKGDFVTAAARFRDAYAADPRPELICNVGIAYYKTKQYLPRAERYLDQCETTGKGLEKPFLANVAKVHQAVLAKLAAGAFTPIDFAVEPATASIAIEGGVPFDEPIVGPRRVWFPFGTYQLVVHAEGYVDRTVALEAKGHAPMAQPITLEREPVAPPPPPPDVDAGSGAGSGSAETTKPAVPPVEVVVPPPARPVLVRRSRTPAIIASAATAGLGVAALGAWALARSRADDAGTQIDPTKYEAAVDSARTAQHLSWGTGIAAGVGALVSGYLWYRSAGTTRVDVEATGTSANVALRTAW